MFEDHINKRIKVLRTKEGCEYTSKAFELFFGDKGIQNKVIVPYTSWNNGLSEKRNKTILDIPRCKVKKICIIESFFWGRIVNITIYMIIICPTKRINNMVFKEVGSGKKPSVHHFRVFGVLCHKHVPSSTRRKAR